MNPAVYALHPDGAPDDPGRPVTITVTGELDATNAAAFDHEVGTAATDHRRIVLDISAVKFIDSAGFAALHSLEHRHGIAVVVGPQSHLRRSAELMGLPFFDDAEAARSGSGAA